MIVRQVLSLYGCSSDGKRHAKTGPKSCWQSARCNDLKCGVSVAVILEHSGVGRHEFSGRHLDAGTRNRACSGWESDETHFSQGTKAAATAPFDA